MLTSIGDFEIKGEIGHGGMGRVYRAYDPRVGRDVAIKVLTNEGDGDLLARFRSEAGTTAKLTHKNIVTVYAYGEQDGMPYIVMELLQGEDLRRIIQKHGSLSLLDKVRILHQVADGLAYAHQNNIIHRDIKPGNIMVLPDGTAKIMDFGIARVTGSNSTRRTQKGFFLGTIAYMAPEQFKLGMDADQLVDIFAYGDVAYELITGEHPFGEGDAGTMMFRISSDDPKGIRELVPDCPELLASIVQQLLAKDRDLRYQSLRDMMLDLQPVLFHLRSERAAQIVQEVHRLMAEGQNEAALTKVKEALELEPMNWEADRLKRQLQQEVFKRAIGSKIATLLADVDQKVGQRRLGEAIALLETALQLEKSPEIQARLEEVRREQQKVKRAVQLLAEARDAERQGNLLAAQAKVAEALAADPRNTQATQLDKRLKDHLEQAERRVREALELAFACAAQDDFHSALEMLEKVAQAEGPLPEIAEGQAKLRAAQAAFEARRRQQSFEETILSVRRDLSGGNLQQARIYFDQMTADYGHLPGASERIQALGQELAAREREAEIAGVVREAEELSRREQFADARARLDAALARYLEDRALQASLAAVLEAKAARDREHAMAATKDEIARLRQQADLGPALEAARAAQRQYPDLAAFAELAAQIESELQERRRHAQIEDVVIRASALLQSDPFQAVQVVQAGLAESGTDAKLENLLIVARAAAAEHREQQIIDQILASVEALRKAQQWRKAREELDAAIARYPQRSELRRAAVEVRDERDRKLRGAVQAIEKSLAAGEFQKCRSLIEESRQDFPDEAVFRELAEEAAQAEHAQELAALAARVRQSLAHDDLETAIKQLAECVERFPEEKAWQTLGAEVEQRRSYLDALENARQLSGQGRFDEAEQVLREALANPAGDKRAEQLSRSMRQQRARAEEQAREQAQKVTEARERARLEEERKAAETRERQAQERRAAEVSRCATEARQLQEGGDLKGALARLEAGLALYPEDPRLFPLAKSLRKQIQEIQKEREEATAQCVTRARELQEAGSLEAAIAEVDRGLAAQLDETRLGQLRSVLVKGLAEAQSRRQDFVNKCLRQAQKLREAGELKEALAQVERGLASYPDETSLRDLEVKLHEAIEEERRKRDERVLGCLAEVQGQSDSDLSGALARIRQALAEYPDEPRLMEAVENLQELARERAREREEFITTCLAEARKAQASGDLSGALSHVSRGLASYPDEVKLVRLRDALQKSLDEAVCKKGELVSNCIREIKELQAAGDLQSALAQMNQALSLYPGSTLLSELYPVIVQAFEEYRRKKEELVTQCLLHARQFEARNDLEAAAGEIQRGLSSYPREPRLLEAQAEFKARLSRVWYRRPVAYIVLALVLAGAIAYYLLHRPPTPPPPDLKPRPERVRFNYQIGSEPPDPQNVVWDNPAGEFTAVASAPWITVSPGKGERLDHLQVGVNTGGLGAGRKEGAVKISVKTDLGTRTFGVPVSIEVTRVPPKEPTQNSKAPEPELQVDRSRIEFSYQQGGSRPVPQYLRVRQGRISKIVATPQWLIVTQDRAGLKISVNPDGLPIGPQPAALVLRGTTGTDVAVDVNLNISAAPPRRTNEPPPPKRLSASDYNGDPEGDCIWTGTLSPGGTVTLDATGSKVRSGEGQTSGKPIPLVNLSDLETRALQAGVTVTLGEDRVTIQNGTSSTINRVTIHWKVKD